jgi:hypothetical protein
MPETNYLPDPRQCAVCTLASRGFGNSGGGGQIYTGAAAPSAPDDPTEAAIYYPTGGGPALQWDVASQAWL